MPIVRRLSARPLPPLATVAFDKESGAQLVEAEGAAYQRVRRAADDKTKQAALRGWWGVLARFHDADQALRRDDASIATPASARMDALVHAASLGDVETIKSGLPLTSAGTTEVLVAAARNGRLEAVRVLVESPGFDPSRLDREGTPLLVAAAQSNDARTVAYVLSVAPLGINAQDAWGHTAFDWAVVEGSQSALAPLLAKVPALRTDGWLSLALKSPQRGRAQQLRRLLVHGLDPGDAPCPSTASSVVRRLVAVGRFQATPTSGAFLRLLSWDAPDDADVDAAASAALRRVVPHWDTMMEATVADLRSLPPRSAADRRVARVLRWWVDPGGEAGRPKRVEVCMALWRALRAVAAGRVALRAAADVAFEADGRWRRGRMLALWYEAGSAADDHVRLLCWKAVTGDDEALESGDLAEYVLNALPPESTAPSLGVCGPLFSTSSPSLREENLPL